jgi:hypothetical protein
MPTAPFSRTTDNVSVLPQVKVAVVDPRAGYAVYAFPFASLHPEALLSVELEMDTELIFPEAELPHKTECKLVEQ